MRQRHTGKRREESEQLRELHGEEWHGRAKKTWTAAQRPKTCTQEMCGMGTRSWGVLAVETQVDYVRDGQNQTLPRTTVFPETAMGSEEKYKDTTHTSKAGSLHHNGMKETRKWRSTAGTGKTL